MNHKFLKKGVVFEVFRTFIETDKYKLSNYSHRHIQSYAHKQQPGSEETWRDPGPDRSSLTGSCIKE